MAKAPHLGASTRLLGFNSPAQNSTGEEGQTAASTALELTVGGRRYRLVPVDPEDTVEGSASAVELLTPREFQIVVLVANGNVNKQVADVLRISEWTVSTHLRRIFAKLGVDTRAAMVSRCVGCIALARK